MSNAILGINFGQSYASIAVIDKVCPLSAQPYSLPLTNLNVEAESTTRRLT